MENQTSSIDMFDSRYQGSIT
ncbi:hypothetical protein RDI58_000474 [Solanum bulbocastanum]|uniref:Uncharacterized protein n=1 Tax=Solanum bulbocastanum TaxID=147425 RepID=A0AAN8UB24_SOLBU